MSHDPTQHRKDDAARPAGDPDQGLDLDLGLDRPEPAMPELLRAMRGAIGRGAAAKRRQRRVARGAVVGVVLAFASGTALAASGGWHPFAKWDDREPPTTARGPAPADQRETLAVLRRPQNEQDRSEIVTVTLRLFSKEEAGGVRVDSVRYLRPLAQEYGTGAARTTATAHLILIPLERLGPLDPRYRHVLQRRVLCLWSTLDSWPEGRQEPIPFWSGAERFAGSTPKREPDLQRRVTSGGTCGTAHQIRTKGLMSGGSISMGRFHGVVPDGVAVVRATAGDGTVVSNRVVNNAIQLVAPVTDNGRWGVNRRFRQQSLQWVAADGRVLRRF